MERSHRRKHCAPVHAVQFCACVCIYLYIRTHTHTHTLWCVPFSCTIQISKFVFLLHLPFMCWPLQLILPWGRPGWGADFYFYRGRDFLICFWMSPFLDLWFVWIRVFVRIVQDSNLYGTETVGFAPADVLQFLALDYAYPSGCCILLSSSRLVLQ